MKIRGTRAQKQQRPCEILWLAQPADRHSCEEAGAHFICVFIIFEHPAVTGERKTVGAMALTVMPCLPHSHPKAFVNPSTAALDVQ
jgi:hypothetical protein